MKLLSPAFTDKQPIPLEYTCRGKGMSPPLQLVDIPVKTQSLVLTMIDPDGVNGTVTHWFVWNISPTTHEIPEGVIPVSAVEGLNSRDKHGYLPPCPPEKSVHQYEFTLYALDKKIQLHIRSVIEDIEAVMAGHLLAKAELFGSAGRE